MKKISAFGFTILSIFALHLLFSFKPVDRVLVFSKTTGFRHANIEVGVEALRKLGSENNFEVEVTESSAVFTPENLKRFKALVFLNPTGTNIFNDNEKEALKKYINNGGGFVGIHAAADCSYEWEWYGKMVGAYFKNHPKIQEARLDVVSQKHPATAKLPKVWMHKDEWYNYKNLNPEVQVLIKIDEKSYEGGENGENHPISWYHNYDGGRVFYTGLGHTKEDFTENKNFLTHILGGLEYAMGRKSK